MKPANILVVDDEASIRKLVATLLEANGHHVGQAEGGAQALALAETWGRPVDVLVTDVRMQGMDGASLAREIVLKHPRVKIIFMSGYFGEEDGRPEAVPGNWEFLAKPFALPDLLMLVKKALGELVGSRG